MTIINRFYLDEVGNLQIHEVKDQKNKPPFDHYWQPVIDGKDSSRCYPNLLSAIIGIVCLKQDGINTQADRLICKMLSIPLEG